MASFAPVRSTPLIFGAPHLEEAEIAEVVATLRSGWIGTGPKTALFEERFREYLGCPHAVAVNSCTAALHLAMLVSGIGPGDEVITSPLTFCATANAIIHAGARPVFADIRRTTLNLAPERVEAAVTPRTKAILPVHFAGRPCEMGALREIARRHGLLLIEDAAHAIEATYHGCHIGTLGDLACFSFYVTKNVTTAEGGMVTTGRKDWADRIKIFALHGMDKDAWKRYSDEGYRHYEVVGAGFKYNMMDIQASIGLHQLSRVEKNWERRREIWERYQAAFTGLPCFLPPPPEPETRHALHLYTPLIDVEALGKSRDQVMGELWKCQIGTGVHYLPLHLHPFYREAYGFQEGSFPEAEFVGARTLSLPLSPALSDQDVEDVIAAFRYVLQTGGR